MVKVFRMRANLKSQVVFSFVLGFIVSQMVFGNFKYTKSDLRVRRTAISTPCNQSIKNTSFQSMSNSSESHMSVDKRSFMKGMEWLQDERGKVLRLACSIHQPNSHMDPDLPHRKSLYNSKYSFSICRIFKVASTSWLHAVLLSDGFFNIENATEKQVGGRTLRQFAEKKRSISSLGSVDEEKKVWKSSTNIIMVRNPLSRLVSAYLDKMKGKPSRYYVVLAQMVEKKYKKDRENLDERQGTLTGVPTFEDFINFLLDKTLFTDKHWRDYSYFCSLCVHKYDMIMKMETAEEDVLYLREKLNVSREDYSLIIPVKAGGQQRRNNTSVSQYFENLSPRLKEGVYHKYQFDFDAFGYESP